MLSLLPRSTLRPCSWCARQRYVGASRISNSSVSMGRPLKACATRLAPSRPTGATTLTGRIKLAASAKYTAEPPSVSSTLPKGPSRVSSATEPATRSCGGLSATAACTALGGDHVPRVSQLGQEIGDIHVIIHLHPASSQLVSGVGVRPGCSDFAQIGRKPCGCCVGGWIAPRVVDLDDVDAVCQLDQAVGAKVRAVAIERMRYVGEPTHLVHKVHHQFGTLVRGQAACDEQSDHLALQGLGLLADDRQLGGGACQLEGAFDGVVIGECDAVDPAFAAALDQLVERGPAVV